MHKSSFYDTFYLLVTLAFEQEDTFWMLMKWKDLTNGQRADSQDVGRPWLETDDVEKTSSSE